MRRIAVGRRLISLRGGKRGGSRLGRAARSSYGDLRAAVGCRGAGDAIDCGSVGRRGAGDARFSVSLARGAAAIGAGCAGSRRSRARRRRGQHRLSFQQG